MSLKTILYAGLIALGVVSTAQAQTGPQPSPAQSKSNANAQIIANDAIKKATQGGFDVNQALEANELIGGKTKLNASGSGPFGRGNNTSMGFSLKTEAKLNLNCQANAQLNWTGYNIKATACTEGSGPTISVCSKGLVGGRCKPEDYRPLGTLLKNTQVTDPLAKVTISLLNDCENKKCSLLLNKEESETVAGNELGNRAFEKIQESGGNSVYDNIKKSYDNPTTKANMLGESGATKGLSAREMANCFEQVSDGLGGSGIVQNCGGTKSVNFSKDCKTTSKCVRFKPSKNRSVQTCRVDVNTSQRTCTTVRATATCNVQLETYNSECRQQFGFRCEQQCRLVQPPIPPACESCNIKDETFNWSEGNESCESASITQLIQSGSSSVISNVLAGKSGSATLSCQNGAVSVENPSCMKTESLGPTQPATAVSPKNSVCLNPGEPPPEPVEVCEIVCTPTQSRVCDHPLSLMD